MGITFHDEEPNKGFSLALTPLQIRILRRLEQRKPIDDIAHWLNQFRFLERKGLVRFTGENEITEKGVRALALIDAAAA
jgi:hypothetical protein